MYYCDVCGPVIDIDDKAVHDATPQHNCNVILYTYNKYKKQLGGNRDGILISCNVESENGRDTKRKNCSESRINVHIFPGQKVKFDFKIRNDANYYDVLIVGVLLGHPQKEFHINDHPFVFGGNPYLLKKKTTVDREVSVTFQVSDIGQYEMPIIFTFQRTSDCKNVVIVREMVVSVEETVIKVPDIGNPYTNKTWKKHQHFFYSTQYSHELNNYKVPKLLKILFATGVDDSALTKYDENMKNKLRHVLDVTKSIIDDGVTETNYGLYFHHLLWWEECDARVNLRRYNMEGVPLERRGGWYILEVPGLAEKRPSVLAGDKVFVRPCSAPEYVFESTIKEIEDNCIKILGLDKNFNPHFSPKARFDIRFIMSRVTFERMHTAVAKVSESKQICRIIPNPNKHTVKLKKIVKFYNPHIKNNEEQKSAVQHIVSRSSGTAPYMVFGPPGTGKTMTIIEAIIQLVVSEANNRILVCTDSNMAADHVALGLLRYKNEINDKNYLLRANSKYRNWDVMPSELKEVSNGENAETHYPLSNNELSSYKVVVTTLLHAHKYGRHFKPDGVDITHLFIDEAAQSLETACLIPIAGLLEPTGFMVLSGDPKQLGPVCISRKAADKGAGISLMERLLKNCSLYDENKLDPNYITMLVKNYRSDSDILEIPNNLYYNGRLKPLAQLDPLSKVNILCKNGGERSIVFHNVNGMEQRMGRTPSFYNESELQVMKKYIDALVKTHKIMPKDIGVITPYSRQVSKVKAWLRQTNYEDIETGSVEAFQGREKRVILVSTVRANSNLLDYDAKYSLGFLVDQKRFNVALTRAKAKLIVIGNSLCLSRDLRWRMFMDKCRKLDTYFGASSEQITRDVELLTEVAITRFDRCKMNEVLNEQSNKKSNKKSNKNSKKKGKNADNR